MSRPLIQIGTEAREMTEAEYSQHQADVEARNAQALQDAQALQNAKAARESALAKLTALGLTEAEIIALLGA